MWKEGILQRILIFFSKWGKGMKVKVKMKYQVKHCPWKTLFQKIKAPLTKMEIEDIPYLKII